MTEDQQPAAGLAPDGWPFLRLGDWLVRPSTVLRRRRKDTARVFYLLPPPGFTGSARLGVIDANGREEFFQSWPGRRPRAALDDAAQPMAFTARLAKPGGFVRADLLLEVQGHSRLSGALELPPLRFDAGTLQLLPIAPPTAGAPPEGEPPEALISAALRRARHEPVLRLALPGDWAEFLRSPRRAPVVRELASQGRLDLLMTTNVDAAALRALALPFPPWVGLRLGEPRTARMRPDMRALLVLPHPSRASCAPGPKPSSAGPMMATDVSGLYLLFAGAQWIRGRVFSRGHEACSAVICDRALRGGVPIEPPGPRTPLEALQDVPPGAQAPSANPEPPGRYRILACQPLCLDHRDDWKHLAGDVRRWNRMHVSPQLQIITPADYFTQIEQLHEAGSIRLAGIDATT
jgi:hypothetical protein